jgi:hypothetical protein
VTIHVPYATVTHSAGDTMLSDEWNDISTAVARIEAAQTPVSCSLTCGTQQSFVPGSGAGNTPYIAGRFYVVFDTVEKDTPGGMQNITGGGNLAKQITCVTSGLYLLSAMVCMSSSGVTAAGAYRTMFIDKNATATTPFAGYQLPPVSGANTIIAVASMQYLNAGDYIALRLDHNATTSNGSNALLTSNIGSIHAKLSAARLSS